MRTRARPEVHDVVRLPDRLLVVLDDEHGVAEVAQAHERVEQSLVVALVQPDRRLVQDVHDADQPGADLAREPDALRLAARERLRAAIEREVIEADVAQEREPVGDFAHEPRGDFAAPALDLQVVEERARFRDRKRGNRRQGAARDEHVARGLVEPAAAAIDARTRATVLREFLAHGGRLGLAVAPLEVRQDAFPRVRAPGLGALGVEVAERDLLLATAPEQRVAHGLGQLLPRRFDVEAEVPRERLDQLEVVRVATVPAADRAAGQRQARVHDDARGVEEFLQAEPAAGAAGAVRVVERKKPRLELGETVAADRAGEAIREQQRLARGIVVEGEPRGTLRERERGLERFGESLPRVGTHLESVDHGLDRVTLARVERRALVEFVERAVDARPHEPLAAQVLEDLRVLALAVLHDRREQQHARALGQRQHLVDHLRDGLRRQVLPVLGTARHARACVQHAQVVVDLGDGADGGARVVRRRLLLDRDRGREALDVVDVRLLHHREELSRVGRQRFDVATLALRVDRVERERRLAGARQPRDHDQPVARQVEVDAAQVVRARAADANHVHAIPAVVVAFIVVVFVIDLVLVLVRSPLGSLLI